MHIDLTRHSLGWTMLLFAGLTALFWMHSLLAPLSEAVTLLAPLSEAVTLPTQMPLGLWIDRAAAWMPALARNAVTVLIVFWNGLLLTRVVSRNMLLLERTYMPFILYLVLSCGLFFGETSLAPYVASALLVTAFDQMIGSFRRVVVYAKSFDSALLMGLSVLVYAPCAIYALLLPCSLILFRKGWREWLTTLSGLVLPMLIASYVYWGLGEPFSHLWNMLFEEITQRVGSPFFWQILPETGSGGAPLPGGQRLDPMMLTFAVLVLLITAASLVVFLFKSASIRTRPYKTFLYFVWILLFSLALLFTPGGSRSDLPLLGAPLAIIMPTYFNHFGGWPGNVGYLLLLGSVILYNLFPILGA